MSTAFASLAKATHTGRSELITVIVLGMSASIFALSTTTVFKFAIAAIVCSLFLLYWALLRANRWMVVFFAVAILAPPLSLPFGDSGPHPALIVASVGVLSGILARPQWRNVNGVLPLLFILFTLILLGSTVPAAIYSGPGIALGSFARALLFAIAPYVFVYTLASPGSPAENPVRTARLLFRFGAVAAVFACIDFHYQFPAPAGYEPQFIWLGDLVIRRAQGLFYDASTLGNFCTFFLVMILAALANSRLIRIYSSVELGLAAAVFAVALVFSYSRASLLNAICAGTMMLFVQRGRFRWIVLPVVSILIAAVLICVIFPSFGESYWLRVEYSILNFSDAPGQVLSGRISSWMALRDFIAQHPWHLILGIGYKTLPYSDFTGRKIIADNAYLALLVETGLIGVTAFVVLNVFILRAGIRACRSPHAKAKFFGTWITCFWVGELVQMFSGDLITYWRVLPLYLWVLATAIRETNAHSSPQLSRLETPWPPTAELCPVSPS